jgi:hypothetical protein
VFEKLDEPARRGLIETSAQLDEIVRLAFG